MRKISKYLTVLMVAPLFFLASCIDSEDLMTGDVKTGGLVTPITSNVPYKLNATPSIDINLLIPQGPAITKIEAYKTFTNADGKISNSALVGTVDVAGANVSEVVEAKLNVTYSSLIKDLVINGSPMPANEGQLKIGEFWTVTYAAVMADDSRVVFNAATTKIGVANAYAGSYHCVGVFNHPVNGPRDIDEEKFLTPIDAYSCYTDLGDLGSAGYDIKIVVDPATNDCTVTAGPNQVTDVFMVAGAINKYYPAEKKFVLNYFYVGGTGNRVISETYTLK